jgi:hypothetical protein
MKNKLTITFLAIIAPARTLGAGKTIEGDRVISEK